VPLTPDRRPGVLEEDEAIQLGQQAVAPTVNGEFRYVTGVGFRFYEEGVEKGLTGTGISEAQHKTLLQLIHFIDGGPAEGFTTGATRTTTGTTFPSQILWRRADATKLVEKNLTYTGAFPTTIEWKIYAADGTTVLATVTDTITYSGAFETGRTRAIT
jgi:hypothetical protein